MFDDEANDLIKSNIVSRIRSRQIFWILNSRRQAEGLKLLREENRKYINFTASFLENLHKMT